ncbi:CDP-diacylglycerol--serine O-phosphatidyltransferase [Evansella clarkii]|uniref:CDP-diacylglycerol--serine O-phosphatidyltransferase n=2 Tax=Evansella clarkii TaxID=79879 RepID=UPI002F2615DB
MYTLGMGSDNLIKRNIPNIFTLSNLLFGFLSIGFSIMGEYQNAAVTILIGMMLDSMDGRLARKLNAETEFGKELDSLADIVTFGVAPAILIFTTTFADLGILGLLIASMFPVCGAIRLARFNVDTSGSSSYFTGVPITAAGGIIALLTLFDAWVPDVPISIVYTLLSVLMISRLKIPSLKEVPIPKYGTIITVFFISMIIVIETNTMYEYSTLFIVSIPLYIVFMSVHFILKKNKLKKNSS